MAPSTQSTPAALLRLLTALLLPALLLALASGCKRSGPEPAAAEKTTVRADAPEDPERDALPRPPLESPQLPPTPLTDSDIAHAVHDLLQSSNEVESHAVDIAVRDGVVTLSGKVKSERARTEAEQLARDTDGVVTVRNLIEIAG